MACGFNLISCSGFSYQNAACCSVSCQGFCVPKISLKEAYQRKKVKWSPSVMSNSLRPHGLGRSTGVDCHFLLQRIILTQGSNPGLLHCRQTLYLCFPGAVSHQGSTQTLSRIFKKTKKQQQQKTDAGVPKQNTPGFL